jgi:hypothetical protein
MSKTFVAPSPKPPRAAKTVPPEYQSWRGMKDLCRRPKHSSWHRYGGRGIAVCARWANSFETFLADMGPKPSPQHFLARIDKDGNYEPGDCRWATPGKTPKAAKPGVPWRWSIAVPRRWSIEAKAEYRAWTNMKEDCRPGGYWHSDGIKVCTRWSDSFESFLADMGPKPSPKHVLARLDVGKNFEPGNCQWVTRAKRNKNNRSFTDRMNQLKPLALPRRPRRA